MSNILSLGAGVQSSTLALMAALNELPYTVDCAIFSDTGWEPKAVYDWLDWLETQLPYPVYRVSAGNIRSDILSKADGNNERLAAIPWYTMDSQGKKGMGLRQCTGDYKIRPLQRKVVEILGGRPKGGCNMLIGISTDEAHRMKPSKVQYIKHEYPLIDKGMSRIDCLNWMQSKGFPKPPKSSCIGCPYHSNEQWRSLSSEEFADAVLIDKAIRNQPGFKSQQFMHRSCKPLDEIDFRTQEEHGQVNMFINECEGMCGV